MATTNSIFENMGIWHQFFHLLGLPPNFVLQG